jgi:hypothetical protein
LSKTEDPDELSVGKLPNQREESKASDPISSIPADSIQNIQAKLEEQNPTVPYSETKD